MTTPSAALRRRAGPRTFARSFSRLLQLLPTQCDRGYLDCDGNPSKGCETAIGLANCGGCGVLCSPDHVTVAVCSATHNSDATDPLSEAELDRLVGPEPIW